MKLKEPRSFSSSFIFFLFSLIFFISFFLLLRTNGNTMHLLHLPPMLERLLVLKQWSDDNLMEWVHKTFINSLDSTLDFNGVSPRERLKPTEEEKASTSSDFSSANSLMLPKLMFYWILLLIPLFCRRNKNIYSIYRLWLRRCFTKKCFWLRVDIQRGLRCSQYRNSQCMDRMAGKIEVRKNTEWSSS